jgi:hypothetical protein
MQPFLDLSTNTYKKVKKVYGVGIIYFDLGQGEDNGAGFNCTHNLCT